MGRFDDERVAGKSRFAVVGYSLADPLAVALAHGQTKSVAAGSTRCNGSRSPRRTIPLVVWVSGSDVAIDVHCTSPSPVTG